MTTPLTTPLGRGGNLREEPSQVERLVWDEDGTVRKAIRERWPIDEDLRREVVDTARAMLRSSDLRAQAAAMRVLAQCDGINAKREQTEAQAKTADATNATSVLRTALSSPEARELLSQVTAAALSPTIDVLPQAPAATIDTTQAQPAIATLPESLDNAPAYTSHPPSPAPLISQGRPSLRQRRRR